MGILSMCMGSLSSASAADSVSLAWDANSEPDLAGYRVHYGTTSGIYTGTIDVGNFIEATVPNLTVGTTYFFAVTAYDTAELESEPSNEVSVTIAPPPPPMPPVNLSTVGAAGNVSLAWAANTESNLAGYRVRYGTVTGIYTETVEVGNHTGATIPSLTVGSTYFFAVTAYDSAELESQPSNEVSVTVAPPPPITFGGTYSGALVAAADGTSAFAELSVTKTRQFTGRIIIGNYSTPVTGSFNAKGKGIVKLPAPLPAWTFTFQLNPGSGSMDVHLVKGTLDVPLKLTSTPYSTLQLAPQAGSYTVRLGALSTAVVSDLATPGEGGFAAVTITPAGRVRTAGRLSDGSAFTSSCYLGANGQFVVHSPLYKNPIGLLAGGLSIRETVGVSDGDGSLQWRKPALPTTRFFRQGFDGTVPVLISRFQKISSLQIPSVARIVPAMAILPGGDLPGPSAIERELAFLSGNSVTVVNSGTERLRLQIRAGSGLVRGTFLHPTDGKLRSIAGVLFQKQGVGIGYFPGVMTTGLVELTGIGAAPVQ